MRSIRKNSGHAIAAAALLLFASTAPVAATPPQISVTDRVQERFLEIDIAFSDCATDGRLTAAITIPRHAVLHHFAAGLLSADTAYAGASWQITLRIPTRNGDSAVRVELAEHQEELSVPRPFGVRVANGDALTVTIERSGRWPDRVDVRLRIGYEAHDSRLTRLPALPVLLAPGAITSPELRHWELQSDVSGRIVAVAGIALADASDVLIEDVATGTVIWRLHAGRRDRDFGHHDTVLRPSTVVEAGRRYRVTARVSGGGTAAVVAHPLHALLMPLHHSGN